MNTQRRFTSVFAAAVLAIAAGQAVAADQGLSREQVQAELQQAIRNGSLVAGGDSGQTLKQLSPNRYTEAAVRQQAVETAQGKTRAQVKAELAEALRTGDIVAGGESGQKLNELFPGRYTDHVSPVLAGQPKSADRAGS